MNLLLKLGQAGVDAKQHLPRGLRDSLVDAFFCYAPVWLIKLIWKELAGYFLYRTPRRGETVIDAGAWTGHFTIIAARLVGPKGRVISIEPQKDMAGRLKERLDKLGFRNVTVVNAGLFDHAGSIEVSKNPTSGFNVFDHNSADGKETVNLRTIDDIVAELGVKHVDFVKMDIEGAELEALSGAPVTLGTIRPFLAVASYHIRDNQTTASAVETILKRHAYKAQTGHQIHLTTWGWPNASAN